MARAPRDRVIAALIITSCLLSVGCTPGSDGDLEMHAQTLRVDLLHTGSADTESFSLAKLILEGSWAGAPSGSTTGENYGPYIFARRRSGALLAGAEYADAVGAFEGANYAASGYYRPEINCIMFTRDVRHFCRVCARALNRTIDSYTGGGE